MSDLKRKITELGEQQEQYKARVTQSKQEKEAITSKYETLKKENENLRELIKIKDGQIEDSRGYETERRGERERLYGEVRKKNEML
jgi:FtsZ-binding cell division protein ZapB